MKQRPILQHKPTAKCDVSVLMAVLGRARRCFFQRPTNGKIGVCYLFQVCHSPTYQARHSSSAAVQAVTRSHTHTHTPL